MLTLNKIKSLLKIRTYKYILVAHLMALIMGLIMEHSLLDLIGYFLVLTIGVSHGANDVSIFFKDQKADIKSIIRFIFKYSLIVVLGIGMFFVIPDVVLVLFMMVSGFHFGQEHFESYEFEASLLSYLFYLSYGLLIIMSLIHIHHIDSLPVINELVWTPLNSDHTYWIVVSLVTVTAISGIIRLRKVGWQRLLIEFLFLLIIYMLFLTSTLVWGFAIYFVLWHSVPSMKNQIHHLYGNVNSETILRYIKSSLLYWIAAIVFLAILYYLLKDNEALFLTIIVAFLGGITFPHVFVMHKLNK